MNIILIGIQGSGKGTQAKLLCERYGWIHITTGELFREHIKNNTELGKIVRTFIERGELVPDKYVFKIVEKALREAERKFVLDGFPRNLSQTEFLVEKFTIDHVILLDLKDDLAMKRLLARRICNNCGRDYNVLFKKPEIAGKCDVCGGRLVKRKDDNETAIKKRIERFHLETNSVIDFFRKKGLLIKINADQTPQKIHSQIVDKIR